MTALLRRQRAGPAGTPTWWASWAVRSASLPCPRRQIWPSPGAAGSDSIAGSACATPKAAGFANAATAGRKRRSRKSPVHGRAISRWESDHPRVARRRRSWRLRFGPSLVVGAGMEDSWRERRPSMLNRIKAMWARLWRRRGRRMPSTGSLTSVRRASIARSKTSSRPGGRGTVLGRLASGDSPSSLTAGRRRR
jgi:hypothetical protein